MAEYIERSALLRTLSKEVGYNDDGDQEINSDTVFIAIESAPAADVAEVVHGEWILLGKNEHDYEASVEEKCSLCGRYVYRYDTELQDNYCPNCGAKMDAKEDTNA